MSSVLYTKQLKEPTSIRWQLLKLIFLLINLVWMVGSVVIAVIVVAMKEDPTELPYSTEKNVKLASDILTVVPLIISFIVNTVGFFGITQLNIRCIQIYTGFLVFNLLCSVILIHPVAILINSCFLVLVVCLINDLNKANFW